jgi:hypothetical protein
LFLSVHLNAKDYRYITIPSGGMLGIIPLQLLKKVEVETGKSIAQLVDGFGGSSTGSIITAALAVGHPAQKIEEFYLAKAKPIFEKATKNVVASYGMGFLGKTDFKGIQEMTRTELQAILGNRRIDAVKFDLNFVVHNKVTSENMLITSHNQAGLVDTILASLSVKEAFGVSKIKIDGQMHELIDAGSKGVRNPLHDSTQLLLRKIQNQITVNDTVTIYVLDTGFNPVNVRSSDPRIKIVSITPDIRSLEKDIDIKKHPLLTNILSELPEVFRAMAVGILSQDKAVLSSIVHNLVAADASDAQTKKMKSLAADLMEQDAFKVMLQDFKTRSERNEEAILEPVDDL